MAFLFCPTPHLSPLPRLSYPTPHPRLYVEVWSPPPPPPVCFPITIDPTNPDDPTAFVYILVLYLHLGFKMMSLVPVLVHILVYTGYRQMLALLVVIVEGVHGLLVLPIHPAFFTETQQQKKTVTKKMFCKFGVKKTTTKKKKPNL